ncbi:MAG: ligand-binding sensor domain-containing protein [Flavobacteriales bacterium]|jgi:ligand-binding sensor domain-containing protein
MTLKTPIITLLTVILTAFLSCSGQVNTEKNVIQSKSLGSTVTEIDSKIWTVYQDHNGNYWYGSNGSGVYHYDGKIIKNFTTNDGLIDMQIRGIQGDNFGNVFIETPKGISKYDGKKFSSLKPITAATNEWKLEPNDLWFNCNSNAQEVYRYDGESLFELELPRTDLQKAFGIEIKGLDFEDMNHSPYAVFGLDKDKEGNLWIGTITAGAYRYNGESFMHITEKELTTLPDGRVPGVRSMLQDKNGYYWLSNFKSKYDVSDADTVPSYEKFKGVDMTKKHLKGRIGYFNSGLVDDEGNLWMTTYGGGVWKYNGKQLFNIPIMDGETEILLISIYQDDKGVFWLGTDNVGVLKFNGETYEKFNPSKNMRLQNSFLDTVKVSTSEELIENIQSNRIIKLANGNFNLSSTLVLDGISNLKIMGAGSSHLKVTEQNKTVIALLNCNNIQLDNMIIGHSESKVLDGEPGILQIKYSSNIAVSNCKLIPGETFGLVTFDVTNMEFTNSEITDCSVILFELEKSQNITFENAKFHDNKLGVSVLGGFTNSTKDVTFSHCKFINNTPNMPGNPAFNFMDNWKEFDDKIVFENCTFQNNKGYKWNGDKIKLIDCKVDPSDFRGFPKE